MPIYALGSRVPVIDDDAFVHPDATVIGDVRLGPEASVWPGAVLRGDYGTIIIGARTSIQDGTVIHTTPDLPTVGGADCIVGHLVHLEGCQIEDSCLIGSNSVVLHRVIVRTGATVGASALVTNGTEVPAGALAIGVPARIKPDASSAAEIALGVAAYIGNAKRYRAELRRLD